MCLAGCDEIVDNVKINEWFKKIETDDKAIKVFGNFRHVMPFEEEMHLLVNFISAWASNREMAFEDERIKN